ncbi:hypothetical protein D8674_038381 [Pyrus ussuriensis x Pyrus communis]|uniref:Uncharacterized protein n=1 Tax=Pyrus ussuriensis x Pyrus communis TaxID=2448454 RepID=A0A5N5I296_9ROSA|nr:hypothetical protein D8674_038381 [Pyrus ussuriensis x Pyrus communis]
MGWLCSCARVFLAKRIFCGLVPCLVSLTFTEGSGGPIILWKIRNLNINLRLCHRFECHQLRCSPWRHPCLFCHSLILHSLILDRLEVTHLKKKRDHMDDGSCAKRHRVFKHHRGLG